MIALTWTAIGSTADATLSGLPGADDCASVYYRPHNKRWHAHAHIGGSYLSHESGFKASAQARLEREIDKRSIGLLDVDIVTFAK